MDTPDAINGHARPLVASFSEASIASQLLEDRDQEMSSPATEACPEEDDEEDMVSELLKDKDSDMGEPTSQLTVEMDVINPGAVEPPAALGHEDSSPTAQATATMELDEPAILEQTCENNVDDAAGHLMPQPSAADNPTEVDSHNPASVESPAAFELKDFAHTVQTNASMEAEEPLDDAASHPGLQSSPADPPLLAPDQPSMPVTEAASSVLRTNHPPVIYPTVANLLNVENIEPRTGDQMDFSDLLPATTVDVPATGNTRADQHSIAFMQEDGQDGEEDDDNDDDDDDDEDEEDASSELSEGVDLREELEEALHDNNFSFHGSFYHSGLLTTAPNPCLYISGLGLVGLPLSERDAKALISCSTLAPFGHGERTVVDKDVRDTWEIEPSRIAFANAEWEKYINGAVCLEVCKALGVTIGNSHPRMELYKLLLYEKGSHFLPHQDTQKADGMFATVIILLPSAYTGGQVVVSHASQTKTVDFAPNSLISTALLAWYTDVKHEVKPVASGYRLALSYSVIHVAPPGIPRPSLPDMDDSVAALRRVLRKWKADKYEEKPDPRLIAYILKHEYSAANLNEGSTTLKGADAHRVTFLRDVAEELDHGGRYHRRGKWYDDSESEDYTPPMAEVNETTTSISSFVDLDGASLLPFGIIELGDDCLIPRDPFEDASPDRTEYEGYMGNGAGSLDYWYHRTVLVIMYEEDVDDICFSAGGISYALPSLKRSTAIPPTEDDRLWANRILQKVNSLDKSQAVVMLEYAIKWNEPEMWKTVMKSPSCSLAGVDMNMFLKAWKVFSFETVRVSFEEILARSTQLSERINFIYNLQPKASNKEKEIVRAWCKKESDKVLSSYTTADAKDIPTIMSIIRVAGLDAFTRVMMPNLTKKQSSYPFWIALLKALRDGRQAILEREAKLQTRAVAPTTSDPTEVASATQESETAAAAEAEALPHNAVDGLIERCLEVAASQWSQAPASSYGGYPYYHNQNSAQAHTTKVDRIIEVIEQAMMTNMDICRTLFINILKTPGTSADKFKQIYTPLILRLKTLLATKNLDICAPPFVDLIQVFIGTYLRVVLGKKGQMFNCRLRKIGCAKCEDCQLLDVFILNPTTTTQTFRFAQTRRQHLERQIAAAADLCTYQTIRTGSPHGVQVTKRPEVVSASQWATRQKEAKAFLAVIGPDDMIARIMGARYADVIHAINGTLAFGSVRTVIEAPSTTAAARTHVTGPAGASMAPTTATGVATNAVQSISSSSTHPAPAPPVAAPPAVAGKKRKSNPIILGPVIDLTGEDSS